MGGKPRPKVVKVRTAQDAHVQFQILLQSTAISKLAKNQEVFMVLTLRGALNTLVEAYVTAVGTVDRCSVFARDIARVALIDNVKKVIVAHNHPSGGYEPSRQDAMAAWNIAHVLHALNISMVDSLVIGDGGFSSVKKHFGGPEDKDIMSALRLYFIAHGAELMPYRLEG